MKKETGNYALRLPLSVKSELERLAHTEGTSMNQIIAMAVAEKLAALRTESFFNERRQRADFEAFDRIMSRKGGQAIEADDRLP